MARILVIDNEASSRDYLRLHLETAGHQVFAAEDAIAGLRLAVSVRPDLILSGAGKSGMDSMKLLSGLKGDPLTAPTPIILLLPDNDRDTIRQALDQGADDYLALPVTRETLLQTIAVRLHQQKAVSHVEMRTDPPPPTPSPGTATDPVAAQAMRTTAGITSTIGFTARSAGLSFNAGGTPQEARYGTVLFSDIRNFSTLAELLPSTAELAEVLNAYFVRACEPILQQGGWIVKLLGDGVLAMFEPTSRDVDDHAERALRAALFNVIVAQRFNTWLSRRFPDRKLPDFAVGIGVHTGDVMVVRVNTGAGIDTTIIGDTVNVASRLEEQTKKLGASVVTTLDTLEQAGARFIPGKRGSLLIRGRDSPVEITEILGLRPRQNADMRSLHTYETIKDAVAKNASFIMRVRDQVLAEPHRLRTGQFTPLRPSDAPIKIPDYRLERRLGQGGMSRSFLAEYEPTKVKRVLKVLNINEGGFDLLQRFLQEHDIISQARHTNVATIYGHGQTDTHAYIVMEYFPGGDLRQRMQAPLAPGLVLEYLRQVSEALVAIHARGIVHRDLKPDNLMLREDGSLVLADFGIAKNLASTFNRTRHGEGLGTPFYLSPEQALGKKVDRRCDLYSMGVMFFEMLTGERPYAGEDPPTLLQKHIHAPIPRLPMRFEHLQPLLDKLMAKLPEDRFDSAEDALQAIRAQMDALGIDAQAQPQSVQMDIANPAAT